jgi:hypothetical protein
MGMLGGQVDDMTVANAAFGNDVVGKMLHVGAAAFEHGHLHATVVVQMNVQRCLREVMVIVKVGGKAFRQFALVVIIDIDECGKTLLRATDFRRALLEAGPGEIAHRFGTIGVTPHRHEAFEVLRQIVVDRNGNALHGSSSDRAGMMIY